MIKKTLLSVASIFLIWQSYDLLTHLDKLEINSWGLIIFIAWIINLYITGIFAFSGFAFPTQKTSAKIILHNSPSRKIKKNL